MDRLEKAMREIEQSVRNPRQGLGNSIFLFISRLTPMVNVDLLIRNEEDEVLLTWRSDDFYGPGWHVPGGVVRFKETFEERISLVAAEELGVEVNIEESPKPKGVQQVMHADRESRGHFVSLLFECTLCAPLDSHRQYLSGKPQHGEWAWHKYLPVDLIAVHKRIYDSLFSNS